MDNQLYILSEVLLNYNPKPCIHFNELFKPLYLTCKTTYNKFSYEKRQVFNCDICHFRKIICNTCKLNNTKVCQNCKCSKCCISINLTGCSLNHEGICSRCPEDSFTYGFFVKYHYTSSLLQIPFITYVQTPQLPLLSLPKIPVLHEKYDLRNYSSLKLIYDKYEHINFEDKTEEIVIKNIKTPNFKSTKYFEYKKIKNIKNNYKHNGQQFRKQNQLKQPR